MIRRRIESLRSELSGFDADAILITNETNVRYLSGFTGDSSYLLVDDADVTILTDGRYEIQIAEECPSLSALIRSPSEKMHDFIGDVLGDLGKKRIAIETSGMTLDTFRNFEENCPDVEWVETSGIVESLRMIKDSNEIDTIRKAVSIAERSFSAILPMLSSKWTERDIAHELESRMRFLGAESASFKPIVAYGAAGALPHYQPKEISIKAFGFTGNGSNSEKFSHGGSLLIDWGAKFDGYASDITRTMSFGTISDEFQRAYDAVLAAQLAAIDAIRPGAKASEIDTVARNLLAERGYEKEFNHGLGHGIGLEIHESPRLSVNSQTVLQPGMVVTVEPGVYLGDQFGIRIEDDCLVTDTGCEVLSTLVKGLDDCRLVL